MIDFELLKSSNMNHFIWMDHIIPIGLLPHETGAMACWYYCSLAHRNLAKVKKGAIYGHEADHQIMLTNILWSVCGIYRIENPTELLNYLGICRLEALRIGRIWDSRVDMPGKIDFLRRNI